MSFLSAALLVLIVVTTAINHLLDRGLGNYADSDYKDEENSNNKINKKDSNLSSTPDIQKIAFAAIPTAQTNISMPELPANSNNSTVSPSRHHGTTKTIKAT